MSVSYAILGLLHMQPMSGYDVKKIMQDSLHFYWSGNNNQIYKALLQLGKDGLLTGETYHQEGSPSKKNYHLTEAGRKVLRDWLLHEEPQLPEFKKPFLVQLACAGSLEAGQLKEMLLKYQSRLQVEVLVYEEKLRRRRAESERASGSEAEGKQASLQGLIDEVLADNGSAFYRSELSWAEEAIQRLERFRSASLQNDQEESEQQVGHAEEAKEMPQRKK